MNRKRYCTNELVGCCHKNGDTKVKVTVKQKHSMRMEENLHLALQCLERLVLYKDIRLSDIPMELRVQDSGCFYAYAARVDRHKDVSWINEDIDILKSDINKLKEQSYLRNSLENGLENLLWNKKIKFDKD